MFKISEASAIALHSMVYLHNRGGKQVRINEISEAFKISPNHLSKVLQRLVKCGFLTSAKGSKGGFAIVPEKSACSFWEIYLAIEGEEVFSNCIFSSKKLNCASCIMGGCISKMKKDFKDYMTKTRISDFSFEAAGSKKEKKRNKPSPSKG